MRWKDREASQNVEDRRGMRVPGGAKGVGLGLGGILVLAVVVMLGGDPKMLMQMLQPGEGVQAGAGSAELSAEEQELGQMVAVVLRDTELVWEELFRERGRSYQVPTLVLFSGSVQSACGLASAAVGPFYCPGDQNVYIDLSFFSQLANELGAPGDFAQAYVVAHEVGHHVQKLLGTSDDVSRKQARAGEAASNELSVRLELQADFYAGVWAHHAQKNWQILEEGDVDEALQAAWRIGDDWLQKQAQGYAVPESFTHGTSEQRMRWFRRGFSTGDMAQGDTFGAREL